MGGSDAQSGEENEKNEDFSNGFEEIVLTDTDPRFYGEYKNRVDDAAIRQKFADKNFYEITFKNNGGLVMPIILEWGIQRRNQGNRKDTG